MVRAGLIAQWARFTKWPNKSLFADRKKTCSSRTWRPSPKMKGSHYREANTRQLCCRIFLFNRFNWRFVHRSSPIGNRLRLFRGQDGKWRKSQRERHDRRSPNSSIRNYRARNLPAQWSLGGRPDQRPRTIRARPGHRRDASGSSRVGLLGSGARDA